MDFYFLHPNPNQNVVQVRSSFNALEFIQSSLLMSPVAANIPRHPLSLSLFKDNSSSNPLMTQFDALKSPCFQMFPTDYNQFQNNLIDSPQLYQEDYIGSCFVSMAEILPSPFMSFEQEKLYNSSESPMELNSDFLIETGQDMLRNPSDESGKIMRRRSSASLHDPKLKLVRSASTVSLAASLTMMDTDKKFECPRCNKKYRNMVSNRLKGIYVN